MIWVLNCKMGIQSLTERWLSFFGPLVSSHWLPRAGQLVSFCCRLQPLFLLLSQSPTGCGAGLLHRTLQTPGPQLSSSLPVNYFGKESGNQNHHHWISSWSKKSSEWSPVRYSWLLFQSNVCWRINSFHPQTECWRLRLLFHPQNCWGLSFLHW